MATLDAAIITLTSAVGAASCLLLGFGVSELVRCAAASAVGAGFYLLAALGLGLYDPVQRGRLKGSLAMTALAFLLGSIAAVAVLPLPLAPDLRWVSISQWTATVFALAGARIAIASIIKAHPVRILAIGDSPCLRALAATAGDLRRQGETLFSLRARPAFNWDRPAMKSLATHDVDCVVVSQKDLLNHSAQNHVACFLRQGGMMLDDAALYRHLFERLPVEESTPGLLVQQTQHYLWSAFYEAWKRGLDIVLAAVLILFLAPLMLLIAIAIRINSPGPALFRQRRLGRFCRPFNMHKFRTMTVSGQAAHDGHCAFTEANDARIFWIGRILRPLHLDELPQLFNVLIGDMSLVGPRPEALGFAESMRHSIQLYEARYIVRPGLTGLAQIRQGYAAATIDATKEKLSYDLYYLCHRSPALDLRLLLQTPFYFWLRSR